MQKIMGLIGLCTAISAVSAGAQTPVAPTADGAAPQSASLTLGGDVILTLRATAGGMTPQQRVDAIDGRISDLLGTPDIKTSDVTVYTPSGKAPVIYALGRRLITVDAATAKSEGEGKTPLELAEMWAKTLQQVLPRVNWRPSNEAEPKVPLHPPLTVTANLAQVGGNIGLVTLRNKVVFKITGPQSGGLTAQERADMLTKRLQVAAYRLSAPSATDISVVSVAPDTKTVSPEAKATAGNTKALSVTIDVSQQILVGTTSIITIDPPQAKSAGFKSTEALATAWAKNVRTALGLSAAAPAPGAPVTDAAPPTSAAIPAPTGGGG